MKENHIVNNNYKKISGQIKVSVTKYCFHNILTCQGTEPIIIYWMSFKKKQKPEVCE